MLAQHTRTHHSHSRTWKMFARKFYGLPWYRTAWDKRAKKHWKHLTRTATETTLPWYLWIAWIRVGEVWRCTGNWGWWHPAINFNLKIAGHFPIKRFAQRGIEENKLSILRSVRLRDSLEPRNKQQRTQYKNRIDFNRYFANAPTTRHAHSPI